MKTMPDKEKLTPVTNWDEHTCFGCGQKNSNGLQLKFYTDNVRVYSFTEVPSTMTGWGSTVHGGIISTLLDEIMGWTVIHLYKKLGVTKSMNIEFLKPVSAREKVTLVGSVLEKTGARSARIRGEIYNTSEVLCATSTGDFSIMDSKLAIRLGLVEKHYMEAFGKILGF